MVKGSANDLFLSFCENYDTPEREQFRQAYEAADMGQREKEAKDPVRADGNNSLSDVREIGLPLFRSQTETPIHNNP